MKANQILKSLRDKDITGVASELKELQKVHFNLRMQKATQQLTNTSLLTTARRDVARAKTILAQKHAA